MNKKLFSLWLVLLTMLCVPANADENPEGVIPIEATTTFKLMHNGEVLNYSGYDLMNPYDFTIKIYSEGEVIKSESWMNDNSSYSTYEIKGELTITLDPQYADKTLYYETGFGYKGDFVVGGDDVLFDVKELTINTTYAGGEPLNTTFEGHFSSIDERQLKDTYSYYTGSVFKFYLKTGTHTYNLEFRGSASIYSTGTVDLTEDTTVILKSQEELTYNVSVKGKCGNAPVSKGFSLYRYQNDVWKSVYEATSTSPYCVVDKSGWHSDPFTVKGDTAITLEYQKVTFNIGMANQSIKVSYKNQLPMTDLYGKSSILSETITTDETGKAEDYLMPGTYTYSMGGQEREFTVGNEDMTVNVETVTVAFRILKTPDTEATSEQPIYYTLNGTMVEPSAEGIITYAGLPGGEITLKLYYDWYDASRNYNQKVSVTTTADATKTVDVQLYALRFESPKSDNPYVYDENGSSLFSATIGRAYYLPAGAYSYGNNYSSSNLTEITLNKNTVIEFKYYKLTVKVVDTNGVPQQDIYVSGLGRGTDENGEVTMESRAGTYTVSVLNGQVEAEVVLDSDKTVTLTIPAMITFNIIGNDHLSWGIYNANAAGSDAYISYRRNNDGSYSAYLDPTQDYCFGTNIHGTTKITDGCTITIGDISISSEGMGLAFPMENWDEVSTYNVVVGSPVRLTAIPVTDDKFTKWEINGKDYTEPMMYFKTTEQHTTAKAVFGGKTDAVRQLQTNTSLEFNDSYITLPGDMEGVARIFTLDGRQVKQMGVVGDQIGIYDLPKGAYVLSFQHDGGVINAQFLKE